MLLLCVWGGGGGGGGGLTEFFFVSLFRGRVSIILRLNWLVKHELTRYAGRYTSVCLHSKNKSLQKSADFGIILFNTSVTHILIDHARKACGMFCLCWTISDYRPAAVPLIPTVAARYKLRFLFSNFSYNCFGYVFP